MIQKEKGPGLMRKLFILSLLAMMIAWGIGGCGGGVEGTSADPLGTDSITSFEASDVVTGSAVAPAVTIRGSLHLKATVLSAEGNPVIGREVSFGFVSNASGATLSSINANTGSTGEASIIYTAGMTAGFDVVRVSISNGSTLITNITVGGGTGSYQMTLAADNTSLAAGQTAVITATVTDGSSNPTVGITVTFTLPVNESGASFVNTAGVSVSSISVNTDASGNAVATYKTGSNDSLVAVYDTVRGALVNGSSNAVSITRSAGTARTGYSITITTAAPTVPLTGGSCVIEVNVQNNGTVVNGVTVNFVSTAGSVSPSSRTTDGAGNAATTFTAGAGAAAGDTAGVVTASITVDGNEYAASVAVTY
jgi:hypothetical protein